ncbi:hypothetical protein GJ744_009500 [Endocarpon pusillum]|uniref:Uncharacterized protein n=1 Tax=Endocarpon pusillum TaxID=364733 RepID=A0A8H7AFL6_9EURO|nr:hypothetical protein GJ744_009500 [Endocarpon pusillum]
MGVWTRSNEDRITDVQLPSYSEQWHSSNDVMILNPALKKKELRLFGYETDLTIHRFKILADVKVSPYYDPDYSRHLSTLRPEKDDGPTTQTAQNTSSTGGGLPTKNNVDSSSSSKSHWLRPLKRKHLRKRTKALQATVTELSTPKFTAISIPTSPPRLRNRIILSQDTISLSDPTGRICFEPSPFKVTLETTLLEERPYTIYSTVLQRCSFLTENQDLESTLSRFEVVDNETGYVLSQKPLPSLSGSETDSGRISGHKSKKSRKNPKHGREIPGISRATCTELHPYRASHLTLVSHPIPSKSSTERLFDALRISEPKLLIGRRLRIRLRPAVALWSVRSMREVFGFEEEVKAWPDAYERPLVLKCLDGGVEAEGEDDYKGEAEFEVVE